ncbi:UPF0496 protein 1 [Hibiscus syriacus]|uniref:UPF0496 protein 1 n=1 Tax=Hibiscus syriacus TaxID=106335 RepID=A0A6A2ZIS4_HIBSY|nr:UPF0496 protein 1 [Hibiscus syriacus]
MGATELSSYEAACKLDKELQTFDSNVQARTNHFINTLAMGVEVRALSFDSLKEVTGCLLEMNQEVVRVILECKKDTWKNQELFEIVKEYFENSLQTLDFFSALEKCQKVARDSQLLILMALQQFEEESEVGGRKYVKTLEELRNFKAVGDPFTEEFFHIFQSVYRQQMATPENLQSRKNKLDKKFKYIHSWRKVSSMLFIATFAAVLICSVVAAAIAAPPIAAALAAATSIPYRSHWAHMWLLKTWIDRLEIEIEALLQNADFTIEQEAVKIGIDEIKKQLGVFMKNVEDLGKQADICSQDIRRARPVVLQRIIKHPNH